MADYISTKDYYIRIDAGNISPFRSRIGIPKEIAKEISKFCKTLNKDELKAMDFSRVKLELNIPKYEGYDYFQDLKNDEIELKGEKIVQIKK